MALKLKVPNIMCAGCGETITDSIHTMEPDAKIDVDVQAKTVTVESAASEETIKQAIVAAGFTVEGYQHG
ncbi:heavy-metal-associated domain-containing protein [Synechocystis sp. PCC 7509]|uniref:heavy-metal-associated domain-containing protein n=1 Tax=Synechocystis sp. PCC 7509 TaxID=927677 RepID=UPI0002AC7789|nr:heavy-metal-associated domain-containing protein [Synechocystis sp. PCC 7509]